MPLCLARRTSSEEEWAATNRLETMVEVCLFVLFLCCLLRLLVSDCDCCKFSWPIFVFLLLASHH